MTNDKIVHSNMFGINSGTSNQILQLGHQTQQNFKYSTNQTDRRLGSEQTSLNNSLLQ